MSKNERDANRRKNATIFELIRQANETCAVCKHEPGLHGLSPYQNEQNKSINALENAIDECESAMTE